MPGILWFAIFGAAVHNIILASAFVHSWYCIYLYIGALWGLIPVGETHVTAKPQTVGLVVNVNLGERGGERRGEEEEG